MADIVVKNRLNRSLEPDGKFVEFPRATIRCEEVNDITYVGRTSLGLLALTGSPIWQLIRVEESGGDTKVLWADGNDLFDNIWDNRASLTYK